LLACLGVHLEQCPPIRGGPLQPKRREPLNKKRRTQTSPRCRRLPRCAVSVCLESAARSRSAQGCARVSDSLYEQAASYTSSERESSEICHFHVRVNLMQRTAREGMTNFLGTRGSYILSLSPLQYSNLNIGFSSCCLSPCLFKPLLFGLHNNAFATPTCSLINVSHLTAEYCWRTYFKVLAVLFLGGFLSFFAFKEGILDTPISALGGWPTVSGGFVRHFATYCEVTRNSCRSYPPRS
jgi:hypothetical protein